MARIRYSGLIQDIRGSIGGTTFQRNQYGFTVKAKPNMRRSGSNDQQDLRQFFGQAARYWANLSEAQRAQWNSWASSFPQYSKNNPTSQLSGFSVFVRNCALWLLGGVGVQEAPIMSSYPLPAYSISIIRAESTLSVRIDTEDEDEHFWAYIYVSPSMGPAQNFVGSRTRLLSVVSLIEITADVTTSYLAKFGYLPNVGDRLAIKINHVAQDTGQAPAAFEQVVTVVAPS